jgi:hypothetical protein
MLKKEKGFMKLEGMNYKVDINRGEDKIYFWTNAPKKVTKLLLTLWFTSVIESSDYYIIHDLFQEFGYVIKINNNEVSGAIYLNLNELTY